MGMRKRYPLFFLASIVLLITGCTQTTTGTTPSTLSPLQVLQNSANTMKQLKSSHFEIQLTDNTQTTGSAAATTTTPTAKGTPAASGTVAPQNLNVNIKGSGDQAGPDQTQMQVTIASLNTTTKLAEVTQSDKVYVQNAQGQWYVLNKTDLAKYAGNNPFSGMNIDQNSLLGLVQQANITDRGTEALNGQNLRHISADLNKTALRQLLSSNPDLKNALGQQNLDTLLNRTKSFKSTVDVWIDESKFYVHRTQLKLNMVADTSDVSNEAPKTVSTDLNSIIDLSKFNEPVTINVPTNATPTDNPGAIFGIGKP